MRNLINGESKGVECCKPKGGVGKSTTVYDLGDGFAMNGKEVLVLDVEPQGDLTKKLGQCRPHELPLTLANSMNDVVSRAMARDHPEIMCHHGGFDFILGK